MPTDTPSNLPDRVVPGLISLHDTLVVEALLPEKIGSDRAGEITVKRYMQQLAELLRLPPIISPKTHLSPKYGLSGWVPMERQSAVHLYAWDEEGKPISPFVSVDIATPEPISDPQAIVTNLQDFFRATAENIVWKTARNPEGKNAQTWRQLAEHICRQRLAISGIAQEIITDEQLAEFMPILCKVLNMDQLSRPLIHRDTAWMHWETSGTIASWSDRNLDLDIYTCKAFDPDKAIAFVRERFKMLEIFGREF